MQHGAVASQEETFSLLLLFHMHILHLVWGWTLSYGQKIFTLYAKCLAIYLLLMPTTSMWSQLLSAIFLLGYIKNYICHSYIFTTKSNTLTPVAERQRLLEPTVSCESFLFWAQLNSFGNLFLGAERLIRQFSYKGKTVQDCPICTLGAGRNYFTFQSVI